MTDLSHDADQLEPSSADRATLLITVGSSSIAFAIGFNYYGAFDTVFFDRLFTVWAIATIVFVASIITVHAKWVRVRASECREPSTRHRTSKRHRQPDEAKGAPMSLTPSKGDRHTGALFTAPSRNTSAM